jgi:RimJ/RimL family protein N-acetyltransferase
MDEYLREASERDLDLLYGWANDPEVRKNSFSTAQIPYLEHQEWFQGLLLDSTRKQYIYMAGRIPVGQIRVAVQGDGAEVSYSIGKEWRGQGYGKRMLASLQQQMRKDMPKVHRLTAKVKEGNPGSEHAFVSSGYQKAYSLYELELKE